MLGSLNPDDKQNTSFLIVSLHLIATLNQAQSVKPSACHKSKSYTTLAKRIIIRALNTLCTRALAFNVCVQSHFKYEVMT